MYNGLEAVWTEWFDSIYKKNMSLYYRQVIHVYKKTHGKWQESKWK